MLNYSKQEITKKDLTEVNKALYSNFITQGPTIQRFESTVANFCGAKFAKAVNSATSALHVACLSLNLKYGDWLWTTPNTFVSSSNCALMCGAKIDFVDIDPKTYNICANKLESKLKIAKKKKRLPKIVIPVHFAGQPADMEAIYKLSKIYGFKIIEDASHAIGAKYQIKNSNNKRKIIKVGSCYHSDITIFSFHAVKIITTGEGGMVLTNKKNLSEHIDRLRSHGISRNKKIMKKYPKHETWNYQQLDFGYNYRMTEFQAALGLSQIKRLGKYIQIRKKIAERYDKKLSDKYITKPWQRKEVSSSWHLYPILVNKKNDKKFQLKVLKYLFKKKIVANIHYIPVHLQPFYKKLGFKRGDFPTSEKYFSQVLSLPLYSSMTIKQQNKVIYSLNGYLETK